MAVEKEYFGKVDLLYLLNLIKTELTKYVNVQADWNVEDSTSEAYIKNKPNIPEGVVVDKELNENSENAIANKAVATALKLLAKLDSPNFTGIPTTPTADVGTNTTQIASTAYVIAQISKALEKVVGIRIEKPEGGVLPETGEFGVIYLIPHSGSATKNIYDEYFWTGEDFELFGTTAVDLTDYLKKADIAELSTEEVQAAWDSVFTEGE